ncbi:unnamed protein product [Protopolystoma xenopodis]|uniref:Uncharacterized protein n=1 Tax=Protopolystoma xenopodis TaxID=117903 RepID=A0A3S5B9Z3_9PLAT|nr:unnamed protein product [Protopolystoma xenopodis]
MGPGGRSRHDYLEDGRGQVMKSSETKGLPSAEAGLRRSETPVTPPSSPLVGMATDNRWSDERGCCLLPESRQMGRHVPADTPRIGEMDTMNVEALKPSKLATTSRPRRRVRSLEAVRWAGAVKRRGCLEDVGGPSEEQKTIVIAVGRVYETTQPVIK